MKLDKVLRTCKEQSKADISWKIKIIAYIPIIVLKQYKAQFYAIKKLPQIACIHGYTVI